MGRDGIFIRALGLHEGPQEILAAADNDFDAAVRRAHRSDAG